MSRIKRAFTAKMLRNRTARTRGGIAIAGRKVVDWREHARGKEAVEITQVWFVNAGRDYEPNGTRERIRRMTQIAHGQLREQNGLVR